VEECLGKVGGTWVVRYAMTGEKLGCPPDEVFTEDEKQELVSDKDASSSG
jgi:hypothetical protein